MQKLICLVVYFSLSTGLSFSQSFWWNIAKTSYKAAPGAAVEANLEIGFCQPHSDSIVFSAETPAGVKALFQPHSISHSQQVVFMIVVTDSTLKGKTVFLTIKAADKISTLSKDITIVIDDVNCPANDAAIYRDSALQYLFQQHLAEIAEFEGLLSMQWTGYKPYVNLLEVDHYVFISGNWRFNVLQHVMIPPWDWKKIYVSNKVKDFYWGVKIDTEQKYHEIPCTPCHCGYFQKG